MHIDKDLVAESESYGYAIAKRVAELSGGHMEWTDGMLYPLLHRLERNGLVEATWGRSATGRRRKHYAITAAGRDALVERQEQWQVVHAALSRAWESLADTAGSARDTLGGPAPAGGFA
jgi:PadR family transcriptional regulator PadR